MRRIFAALTTVLSLAAMAAHADSGKIHVCRAAGSTSTAKSVDIPAGSSFAVGDGAHHIVKTTEAAKLGAKCASIDASSGSDPESQPIKQGKTPITAQFTLPGITLEGTVSRTFKPTGAAAASAKTPASTTATSPAATAAPTAPAASAKTARKSSTTATPTTAPQPISPTTASTSGSSAGTAPTVADAAAPAGSTAKCKDGTYSKSQHHSGTCSHHGGVAAWLTQ
jgi:Protein of unknown function (DUF3761)